MKRISSKEVKKCVAYSKADGISDTGYGQLIHYLIKTIEKDYPVEFMHVIKESVFRGQIDHFTLYYSDVEMGENDTLTIYYKTDESDELESLSFEKTGVDQVEKDKKSSPKSFFRFFVKSENKTPYRLTFNRRLAK